MSARASSANTVRLLVFMSWATRAAVSRPRLSIQYWVFPSAVNPTGAVSESSKAMVSSGLAETWLFSTR